VGCSKLEFGSIFQVGVARKNNSVSRLSPKWARGGRESIVGCSKLEFGSIFQVGVARKNNSVSPLSLWERVRVRGFCSTWSMRH
jgi:hypothetical protein